MAADTRFKPGQSGNPAGRQKGSRNKLAEDFLGDLHASWQKHGKGAIERMVAEKPNEYVKVVAGLLPQKLEVERTLSGLSDDELADAIAAIRALAGEAGSNAAQPGAGADEAGGGEPASGLSPLH